VKSCGEGQEVVSAAEITGVARVVAGYETFENVRYRIRIVETKRKRGLVDGMIEAPPAVISALHEAKECAIELPGELGWFTFVVTDVPRGAIKVIGRAKI
jgi:hypothetical protein